MRRLFPIVFGVGLVGLALVSPTGLSGQQTAGQATDIVHYDEAKLSKPTLRRADGTQRPRSYAGRREAIGRYLPSRRRRYVPGHSRAHALQQQLTERSRAVHMVC